jgi:hypothetical protein
MARLHLAVHAGSRLLVTNQDVDMHLLRQMEGPHMMLGRAMPQGGHHMLRFMKPGVYRFTTKVMPMSGMPEVETTGPDNVLRLTVTVT